MSDLVCPKKRSAHPLRLGVGGHPSERKDKMDKTNFITVGRARHRAPSLPRVGAFGVRACAARHLRPDPEPRHLERMARELQDSQRRWVLGLLAAAVLAALGNLVATWDGSVRFSGWGAVALALVAVGVTVLVMPGTLSDPRRAVYLGDLLEEADAEGGGR